MAIMHFTREQILAAPLDEEEYALLQTLAVLDCVENYSIGKHARPLICSRIQALRDERIRIGIPPFDSAEALEIENELRDEMDNRI